MIYDNYDNCLSLTSKRNFARFLYGGRHSGIKLFWTGCIENTKIHARSQFIQLALENKTDESGEAVVHADHG